MSHQLGDLMAKLLARKEGKGRGQRDAVIGNQEEECVKVGNMRVGCQHSGQPTAVTVGWQARFSLAWEINCFRKHAKLVG